MSIHPSRPNHYLTQCCCLLKKEPKLLLTTHNPALMDVLPDQALGDVVFAYRDKKQGDSRFNSLK